MHPFYVWLVPLLWAVLSLFSFNWPGDEYAFWAVASLPGVWWNAFMNTGDIRQWWIPVLTAGLGAAVLVPFGWLMDRLRVSRRTWAVLFGVIFVVLLANALLSHPSLQRAWAKNGPLPAYLFGAAGIAAYVSVIAALAWEGARRLGRYRP